MLPKTAVSAVSALSLAGLQLTLPERVTPRAPSGVSEARLDNTERTFSNVLAIVDHLAAD